ncbi:GNAT family N-acetyltransferase [Rhizobium mongolense]|uniref:GNAT family N-acetyltransferase n=1 Tax=Rhizobium mongolense TaxID=57676 RepID=UPI0034A0E9BE
MTAKIAIEPLNARPEMIPVRASWTFGHWDCQAATTFEETNRLFCDAANDTSSLPLTFVTIANGKPAGMISLRENDFKERTDLSPWLASLYVHPAHRNLGISLLLIEKLETEAERLGYKKVVSYHRGLQEPLRKERLAGDRSRTHTFRRRVSDGEGLAERHKGCPTSLMMTMIYCACAPKFDRTGISAWHDRLRRRVRQA